jgi:hypothetical protein
LPVAATDNGLPAPELAAGIARVKSAKSNRRQVPQVVWEAAGAQSPSPDPIVCGVRLSIVSRNGLLARTEWYPPGRDGAVL